MAVEWSAGLGAEADWQADCGSLGNEVGGPGVEWSAAGWATVKAAVVASVMAAGWATVKAAVVASVTVVGLASVMVAGLVADWEEA